uniref:Uncharacterized protein n=2 Tax=unclassified Caudoviricetes TaxID=2788787 RepID=A0A8S5P9Z6_9CAUD|nr:MAG TPA: hypothetical protein [Siphoviridae sp. ctPat53]DAE10399.1 MAG TPA: hypothetical protein [Siphoviridae sp. ct7cV26]
MMRLSIDSSLPVKLRRDADVETALIGFFRLNALCGTKLQIVVYRTVKIFHQFLGGSALVRKERTDAQHLAEENAVRLRKFHAAQIAFIFHGVTQINPSCSRISISCLT